MSLALALPLTVALFLAWSWTAYCIAVRLTADAPGHVRVCATAIAQLWLGIVLFHALGAVHAFRLVALIPTAVALTALAHARFGAAAWQSLRADAREFGDALRRAARDPLIALPALVCALFVGARLLRGMVSPPLAWDALMQHAYRAAAWVQTGGPAIGHAPDQDAYYAFYPHGGVIPWAWAMLPAHADALLVLATVWIWSLVGVGGYGLGRALGAGRRTAAAAALAIASLPPSINLSTSDT